VFLPGAGGLAWYWHRVVALVEEAGHNALAVDLPVTTSKPVSRLTLTASWN